MSFYIGLLLAVPEDEEIQTLVGPPRKVTVWQVERALDLSTLKTDPREDRFAKLGVKHRAKTYLLDLLWPPLSQYIEAGEFELAPKFVIYEDDFSRRPDKFPTQVVRPERQNRKQPIPSFEVMEHHNSALVRGERPRRYSELKDPGSPLMWLPSRKLWEMIESTRSETRQRLDADLNALSFFRVWMSMLWEFGKMDGRVIVPVGHPASDAFYYGD